MARTRGEHPPLARRSGHKALITPLATSAGVLMVLHLLGFGTMSAEAAPVILESHDLNGFKFGMEYVGQEDSNDPGLFATDAITWAKGNGYPHSRWRDLEPEPPVDGVHTYTFDVLDRHVLRYQSAGFEDLALVLQASSDWAVECGPVDAWRCPDSPSDLVSSPPIDDERWDDYAAFIRAVVERYDGDGVDDVPGLIAPIRYWEIETEVQHGAFWQVTCDGCTDRAYLDRRISEYLRLLEVAGDAAREADPDAKIMLAGLWFWDVFDRGPVTLSEMRSLIAAGGYVADVYAEVMRFILSIVAETDLYDAVEFHQLSHYTGVEGSVAWLRRFLAWRGVEKEIHVGDALSGPTLFHNGPFQSWEYFDGARLLEVVGSGDDLYGYDYREVERWYRAEQARYTAKQTLLAVGSGATGMNLFQWKDFPPLFFEAFPMPTYWLWWTWGIQGLADVTAPGAEFVAPRPAMTTYQHLASRLHNVTRADRVEFDPEIRAYRFTIDSDTVWVLWIDASIARQYGEAEPKIDLALPLPTGRYGLTRLPSERGEEVETTFVDVLEPGFVVEVSDMPILIQEAHDD